MQCMTNQSEPMIVAVSGGIDSVVMLDRLVTADSRRLIVAHVDHGIREDSAADEAFVASLAQDYDLEYVSTKLNLGTGASEDTARQARYTWLEKICAQYEAEAIATAHHLDDVLETIIINLVRGTGWRGLCSLRETPHRHRPLLRVSKAEIIDYALSHGLQWREDSTNNSMRYLRNRIRTSITPCLDAGLRQRLLGLYDAQLNLRHEIETELHVIGKQIIAGEQINRYPLIMIEEDAAIELLRSWLGESLEQSRYRDLLLFAKTARPGTKWSLDGGRFVLAKARTLIVSPPRD